MFPGRIIFDHVAVSVTYVFYNNAVCTRFFGHVKCVHTQPDVFNRTVDMDVIFSLGTTREFLRLCESTWSDELYHIGLILYTKSLKSAN